MPSYYGKNPYTRSKPPGYSQRSTPPRRGRGKAVLIVVLAVAIIAVFSLIITKLVSGSSPASAGVPAGSATATASHAATKKPTEIAWQNPTPTASTVKPTPSAAATTSGVSGTASTAPSAAADTGDGFTSGDVVVDMDKLTYRSADLVVKVTKQSQNGADYYVADCQAKDSNRLFSAIAGDKYPVTGEETVSTMAKRHGAVIAINGDYFAAGAQDRSNRGIALRNGKLYRSTPWYDCMAIFNDGTMKTYAKTDITAKQLQEKGAVQVLSLGPYLMDSNGKALTEAQVSKRPPQYNPANPRTGIGYIAPNHFVLIVVDGKRNSVGTSKGLKTYEFAKLFEDLGCKCAYNLDGGGSSDMVFMGKIISKPCDNAGSGERKVSDMLFFGESETDQATIARMK